MQTPGEDLVLLSTRIAKGELTRGADAAQAAQATRAVDVSAAVHAAHHAASDAGAHGGGHH